MCGIAGISGVNVKNLSEVSDLLAHRGPDDSGIFVDYDVCIGLLHRRLSILDPSPLGHQPMASADGKVLLIFNGEIYNYRELRAELKQQGLEFSGNSDTEVLLKMYLEHREYSDDISSLLRSLNGIFAFALWDADRGQMLLSRDALGVKPLYYTINEEAFAFSSEIKALTVLLPSDGKLDVAAIDRYLSFLYCPGEATPALQVRKVPPGEALWVEEGRIAERVCWYRQPAFTISPSHANFTATNAIFGTQRLLRQAVHRQMVSDVPIGAFLSGGLDSSSVVAFARELNPDIRCFSIELVGFSYEGFSDDLPYAHRVAKHLDVPLDIVKVDSARMASGLEQMVWQLDEPLADPAALNVLFISQLAREQGIKVLLSGVGGDDLFTGYRRHQALKAEHYWAWLPRSIRARLRQITGNLPIGYPHFRRLRKAFSAAHLDSDARLLNYFRWIERADLRALYTSAFITALDHAQAKDPMLQLLSSLPKDTSPLERMLALEQCFFLPDHNLTYTDKMSMAVGVEVRVPFLDLDLVEFAATIPSEYKQRGRHSKWVLKKAMEAYLPHDVIYRPKSGFGAPLRRWLRVELKDWLADVLSTESLRSRGLFDPQAVQLLITSNAEGRIDASYTLLSLACIEIWCKYFIDQRSPDFVKS